MYHFGVVFYEISCFPTSFVASIFDRFLLWKMDQNWFKKQTTGSHFWLLKSTLAPKPTFGCIFRSPCGSLLAPFAPLLASYGSFGAFWLHLGCLLAPFDALSLPFGRFGSLLAPLRPHFTTFRPSACKISQTLFLQSRAEPCRGHLRNEMLAFSAHTNN